MRRNGLFPSMGLSFNFLFTYVVIHKLWDSGRASDMHESLVDLFKHPLPADSTLYEYAYLYKGLGNWIYWPQFVRRETPEINALGIQIPTVDTGRYSQLMEMHIRVNKIVKKIKKSSWSRLLLNGFMGLVAFNFNHG